MDTISRLILPVVLTILLLAGCGGDGGGGTRPEPGEMTAKLVLRNARGGPLSASDTLVSRTVATNYEISTACSVYIGHVRLERFEILKTAITPPGRITIDYAIVVDSLTLEPGDSAVLSVHFLVPEFYPGGWDVSAQATVSYKKECEERTFVLSDDPATPEQNDRTALTVHNEGLDFGLIAPGVPEVYLAGEFNNWAFLDSRYEMFGDGSYREFAITVPAQGRNEYKFIFHNPNTGQSIWSGDPRATRVIPDPYGGLNSVAGVDLPDPVAPIAEGIDPTRLVIYELFTYDFSSQGTFDALAAGITGDPQNLVDLGVNAIEIMPVTGIEGGFNWGYEPHFYFAVDPEYGSPEDFADLVETAHANGIAVILDMVFNHVGRNSPLEYMDEMGQSGVFINHYQPSVFGMRQTNWGSEEMRQFFLDCALFWIEQYGIDGFRMDLMDHLDYAGYLWWRSQIRSRHPDFFVIGEDFNYDPNCVTLCGFDAQWGGQHTDPWGGIANNFQNIVMALLKEGEYSGRFWYPPRGSFDTEDNPMWALANVLEPSDFYPTYHNEIKYIVSHDEHRVAWEVENLGSPEAAAIGATAKAKLGAATLLTAVGIPMFYMGEEIALSTFRAQDPTPDKIDWNQGGTGVRDYYKNLINLRLTHPTLAKGGIHFVCPAWGTDQGPCQQDKIINYWRYPGSVTADANIVVASNYDHEDHEFTVVFPGSGTWYLFDPETGSSTPVEVTDQNLTTTLTASTAYIFLK